MKHFSVLGAFAFVAAGVGLSGCATTTAPGTSSGIVKDLAREARAIARGRGYASSQAFSGGSLEEREEGTLRYTLRAGERYIAIGLCDEPCKDIDLVVEDESGLELASDRKEDAIPIVELAPKAETIALFRVKMIRCDRAPCAYAAGVYRE